METKLKKEIINLPILTYSKIELWLCYKNQKPAASLVIKSDSLQKTDSLINWLKDSGLKYDFLNDKLLLVSTKEINIAKLKDMFFDNSEENIKLKGELFGYPTKATEMLTRFWKNHKKHPMKSGRDLANLEYGKDYIYAGYMLRIGHEKEDVEIAKKWASIIRKDLPKLAEEFENEVL